MTITAFPRPKRAPPKPTPVRRESVTGEERIAADDLHRAAAALKVVLGSTWATPEALARAPRLLAEAEIALNTLKELVGQ